MQQPEVVTLCGSDRFAAQHLEAHRRLSLEGRVVLLAALPLPDDDTPPADVEVLAGLHRQKVDLSDRVHVVNIGGSVGPSTAAEIAYAEAAGKQVTYERDATSVSLATVPGSPFRGCSVRALPGTRP